MQLDFNLVLIIIQVIFLEGILSIDNAAVLGAMVSGLPPKEKVPWPGPLKFLGPPVHRILGGQRSAALKVGLLGAYFGRGLMLIMASFVVHNSLLKFLGAAYLIKLAFENLSEIEKEAEEKETGAKTARHKGFWSIVLAVELADLAFSLDNVVAVVALSDNLYIVMLGVAIGIILMRFAAGIFTYLIIREPSLKIAAYVVIFNIGAELLLSEFAGVEISAGLKFAISAATLVLVVAYARIEALHFLKPVFAWIGYGIEQANNFLNWMFLPITWILKSIFKVFASRKNKKQ